MAPIQKQNYLAYGLFCTLPRWWGSPYPTYSVTHRSSSTGPRDPLLSPHQNFYTGVGNLKSLFLAFRISLSATSTVNTIGLQTVYLKLLSLFLWDLVVFLKLWMTIWSHMTPFNSFDSCYGEINPQLDSCSAAHWVASFRLLIWSLWFTVDGFDWDRSPIWWDRLLMGIYTLLHAFPLGCHWMWFSPYGLYSLRDVTLAGSVLLMPFDS